MTMARVEIWKDDKLLLRKGLDSSGGNAGWWLRLAPHARVHLRVGESACVDEYEVRVLESGPNTPDPPEMQPASPDDSLPELDAIPCKDDDSGKLPDGPSRTQTAHDATAPANHPAKTETTTSLPGPPSSVVPRSPSTAPSQAMPSPGKPWGKYLIEKHLGGGGQAEVYQAYDQFGAAGHVAIKIAHAALPPDKAQAWASAEADPLLKLDHPNIVRVVDAGCVASVPYVATRLVDGLTLVDYVRNHPSSPRRIIGWMIQLTGAVAQAHERGITHRDLKPQNIIISQKDPSHPKIIDFGIARMAGPYLSPNSPGISGTLPFMAPEQARGEEAADHRVDIFALGGVLKFLLVGSGPYQSSANHKQALQVAQDGNVNLVDTTVGPALRRSLGRIANKALQPDPERRFQNAAGMLQALVATDKRLSVPTILVTAAIVALLGLSLTMGAKSLLQLQEKPNPSSPAQSNDHGVVRISFRPFDPREGTGKSACNWGGGSQSLFIEIPKTLVNQPVNKILENAEPSRFWETVHPVWGHDVAPAMNVDVVYDASPESPTCIVKEWGIEVTPTEPPREGIFLHYSTGGADGGRRGAVCIIDPSVSSSPVASWEGNGGEEVPPWKIAHFLRPGEPIFFTFHTVMPKNASPEYRVQSGRSEDTQQPDHQGGLRAAILRVYAKMSIGGRRILVRSRNNVRAVWTVDFQRVLEGSGMALQPLHPSGLAGRFRCERVDSQLLETYRAKAYCEE